MARIDQIYGTHCTYGTSAIERREDDASKQVLGYSARAGSRERHRLRDLFLAVKRFLYYNLPKDAPDDLVLKLGEDKAPRRLFFCPSVSGLRVLGQVCFRKEDSCTPPRPGSYFGHLLTTDENAEPWDLLKCLRLWSSDCWQTKDKDTIKPELPYFDTFEKVLDYFFTKEDPPDYDKVLEELLGLPPSPTASGRAERASGNPPPSATAAPPARSAARPFSGPPPPPPPPPPPRKKGAANRSAPPPVAAARGAARPRRAGSPRPKASVAGMIPPRWRAVSVEARRDYFRAALAGYLDVASGKHKSLLLLAEPEIAVLIVYAIARLLPQEVRKKISFSTCETDPDRLCTSIAAIAFYHFESDLPTERYRRDFVVNTRNGNLSQSAGTAAAYVRLVWDRSLVAKGLAEAERIVTACEDGKIETIDHLDRASKGEDLAHAALDPGTEVSPASWRVPELEPYVRRRVGEHLAALPDARLQDIESSPHLRTVLEMTTNQESCRDRVGELIGGLAQEDLEWYLKLEHVAPAYVDAALKRYAQLIEPDRIVEFLKDAPVLPERKNKVLPHLAERLPVGQFAEFLALEAVPDGLKEKAVNRLAKELPPEQIVPFLQRADIPEDRRVQALGKFVPRVPREARLAFLQLPQAQVAEPFKRRLIQLDAGEFSGREALAVLSESNVPKACRRYALEQPAFLGRVGPAELLPLLRLEMVPADAKKQVLDRLAPDVTADHLLPVLSDRYVDDECKRHILDREELANKLPPQALPDLLLCEELSEARKWQMLDNEALANKLPPQALPRLLLSEGLSRACKLHVLQSEEWAARLPAEQLIPLLQHARLRADCRQAACDNTTLVSRIPRDWLPKVLTNPGLPRPCREAVFRHATSAGRLSAADMIVLLRSPHLPPECKRHFFSRDELVEQVSGDDLVSLLKLQDPNLPETVKEDALERPAVLQKVPPPKIVELLLSLPESCRQAAFGQESLMTRIPEDHIANLLRAELAPQHKKKALEYAQVLGRIPVHEVPDLLGDREVPESCRNQIFREFASRLPTDVVVTVLEISDLDLEMKRTTLKGHAVGLGPHQVAELLTSRNVPKKCKTDVATIGVLLRTALEGDVAALLEHAEVPDECKQALAEGLDPGKLDQEAVVELLEHGEVPDECKQALAGRLAPGKLDQEAVVELLEHGGVPKKCKQALAGRLDPGKLNQEAVVELLEHGEVPDECKQALTGRLAPGKLDQEAVVALLQHGGVPKTCKQALAAGLDVAKLPPERVVEVLELGVMRTPQEKELLKLWLRRDDLTVDDIGRFLASQPIRAPLKQFAVDELKVLGGLAEDDARGLLGRDNIPHEIRKVLMDKSGDLPLEDLIRMVEEGEPQQAIADAIENHLTGHPERVVPFLKCDDIALKVRQDALAQIMQMAESPLRKIPDTALEELLRLGFVDDRFKANALLHFCEAHGALPSGCDALCSEELGPEPNASAKGPMCLVFGWMRADRIRLLIGNLAPAHEHGEENQVRRLSLYVSLFKAAASKPDPKKGAVLQSMARDMVDLRKESLEISRLGQENLQGPNYVPNHQPMGPSDLYQVVDVLTPLLKDAATKQVMWARGVRESFGEIASQVLDDMEGVLGKREYAQVEERANRLDRPYLYELLDEDGKAKLGAWKTILRYLRELGEASVSVGHGSGDDAAWAAVDAVALNRKCTADDIRRKLIEALERLFGDIAAWDRIRGLGEHLGFDVEPLRKTPLKPQPRRKTPAYRGRKKKDDWVVLAGIVGGGVVVGAVILSLLWWVPRDHPASQPQEGSQASQRSAIEGDVAVAPAKTENAEPPEEPAEDKSTEAKPAEEKPAEKKPAEEKSAEAKPVEGKPAEAKPAAEKPAVEAPPERLEPTVEVCGETCKGGPVWKAEFHEPRPSKENWTLVTPSVKINTHSLIALHGRSLVNDALKHNNLNELVFTPFEEEAKESGAKKPENSGAKRAENSRANDHRPQYQAIIVDESGGDSKIGGGRGLLELRLDRRGLSYMFTDAAEQGVQNLLLDCVVEVKAVQSERAEYLSLRVPDRKPLEFQPKSDDKGGTRYCASVNLDELPACTLGLSRIHVGQVKLWDDKLKGSVTLKLEANNSNENASQFCWSLRDWPLLVEKPSLLDLSTLTVSLDVRAVGKLHFDRDMRSATPKDALDNYYGTWFSEKCVWKGKGSEADRTEVLKFLEQLQNRAPRIALNTIAPLRKSREKPDPYKAYGDYHEGLKEDIQRYEKYLDDKIKLRDYKLKDEFWNDYVDKHGNLLPPPKHLALQLDRLTEKHLDKLNKVSTDASDIGALADRFKIYAEIYRIVPTNDEKRMIHVPLMLCREPPDSSTSGKPKDDNPLDIKPKN